MAFRFFGDDMATHVSHLYDVYSNLSNFFRSWLVATKNIFHMRISRTKMR